MRRGGLWIVTLRRLNSQKPLDNAFPHYYNKCNRKKDDDGDSTYIPKVTESRGS